MTIFKLKFCGWLWSIWLKKWNRKACRKSAQQILFLTVPNLSVDFYWSKTDWGTSVLYWLVPAKGQQEFAKQELTEMQIFQEGHTPGIWIWINICISLSHCLLFVFLPAQSKSIPGLEHILLQTSWSHIQKSDHVFSRNWRLEIKIQKKMLRTGFHDMEGPLFGGLSHWRRCYGERSQNVYLSKCLITW